MSSALPLLSDGRSLFLGRSSSVSVPVKRAKGLRCHGLMATPHLREPAIINMAHIPSNDFFTSEWKNEALARSVSGDPSNGMTMQQILLQETMAKDRKCISSYPTMIKTSFLTNCRSFLMRRSQRDMSVPQAVGKVSAPYNNKKKRKRRISNCQTVSLRSIDDLKRRNGTQISKQRSRMILKDTERCRRGRRRSTKSQGMAGGACNGQK